MKSLFAFAIVLLFAMSGTAQVIFSQRGASGHIEHETEFFLTIKSKCKASANSYKCEGGLKFDELKANGWKKDPALENYYEYTGPVEPDLFASHEEKRLAFLKKFCVSDHFEAVEFRDIFTCTENSKKQQIKFQVLQPDEGGYKGREGAYEVVCDAAGGTAWLKMIYPKASWAEAPKMPHYYITKATSTEQGKELSESVRLSYANLPAGCRHMECKIGEFIPDGCEKDNP